MVVVAAVRRNDPPERQVGWLLTAAVNRSLSTDQSLSSTAIAALWPPRPLTAPPRTAPEPHSKIPG